jgi:hypothetical protein
VFLVRRFPGESHKYFNNNTIGDIGSGVDAVCQECGAVTDDAHSCLQHGQQDVGGKTDVYCEKAFSVSLFSRHCILVSYSIGFVKKSRKCGLYSTQLIHTSHKTKHLFSLAGFASKK